jgi:hypothetical protein
VLDGSLAIEADRDRAQAEVIIYAKRNGPIYAPAVNNSAIGRVEIIQLFAPKQPAPNNDRVMTRNSSVLDDDVVVMRASNRNSPAVRKRPTDFGRVGIKLVTGIERAKLVAGIHGSHGSPCSLPQ